jgi:hypothetical protein
VVVPLPHGVPGREGGWIEWDHAPL